MNLSTVCTYNDATTKQTRQPDNRERKKIKGKNNS